MKFIFLLLLWLFSLSLVSQVLIKGPWTIGCGTSSANAFTESSSFNLRYISPRFKWSDDWNDEEEKNPYKYKNMRLMLELIYTPPLKVVCTGFNAQYRLINYKRLSMEIYGGPKFSLVTEVGTKGSTWYMNLGVLWQFNLGVVAPFADIGGDNIITIGTEFNFRGIYKKTKKRYKLRSNKTNSPTTM